ncbi:MAG: hypothetical protein IH991_19660, partial [Planctomycetes bacterium]|nr:hypothetical protein [Planctomycetota bacterium]
GKIGCVFKADGTKQEFQASPDSAFKQWPIVILVNQYTRAEAEFVAAALEDNNRAIIVGQQSAGNGYSRRAVALPDGLGGIMLRTELMTRADGRPLQRPLTPKPSVANALLPPDRHSPPDTASGDWGVTPKDGNVVKMSNEQFRKLLAWRNEQQVIGRPSNKQIPAPDDPQLERAMEILKTKIARQSEKTALD